MRGASSPAQGGWSGAASTCSASTPRGAVVRLPLGLGEGRHELLIGATGAGKTTTMLWTFLRHLEAGTGGVLIDPKGDPELIERCRAEAAKLGRPFYRFSLDGPGSIGTRCCGARPPSGRTS